MTHGHEQSGSAAIVRSSALTGIINAVINGTIQWFVLAGHAPLPLTVDGISSDDHTVFGAAVPLAVSLAVILTAIAYLTVKPPKPAFFPGFVWTIVRHGFFALGVIVTFAVLWQRIFGSVLVSLAMAVVILGAISGVVAAVVNYMSLRALTAAAKSGGG